MATIQAFSVRWIDWISASSSHWIYSDLLGFTHGMERELFPGFGVLFIFMLGTLGLALYPRQEKIFWSSFLTACVAIWASTGPSEEEGLHWSHLPYDLFYLFVPGGEHARVPARFVLLSGLFLTPVLAQGWQALQTKLRKRLPGPRSALAVSIFLLVLLCSESLPGLAIYERIPDRGSVSEKKIESEGILFLPIPPLGLAWQEIERMWLARRMGCPTVNGYSGYFPPLYTHLYGLQKQTLSRDMRTALYSLLRELGVDTIVFQGSAHPFVDREILRERLPGIYSIPDNTRLPEFESISPGHDVGLLLPISGWHYPESREDYSWMWSFMPTARIRLPVARAADLYLKIRVRSLYPANTQILELLLNGSSLGKRLLSYSDSFLLFQLPARRVKAGWNEIEFRGPPPVQPQQMGIPTTDSRKLGLCLFEIQLVAAGAATDTDSSTSTSTTTERR